VLTESDLIHIPYTPDLSEAGIAYACRTLASSYDQTRDLSINCLRQLAGGIAVELAFRRYLGDHGIPFKAIETSPFSHTDPFNTSLGGHRCIVTSHLITHRNQIKQIRRDPGRLLPAPALVALNQFAGENHRPDDLHVFAFLLGLAAASQADVKRAILAGQPIHLIHPLPGSWARPGNWVPLEKLAMKSESETPITLEIGGQDSGRNFLTFTMELPSRQRVLVKKDFHSLAYIHALRRPEARVGIHSPNRGEPYIIPPYAWNNLRFYGMDIFLAGWITHEEFRRKARVLNAEAQVFQYGHTLEKNLFVRAGELNPLGLFLKKVRQWEAEVGSIKAGG
jgi:hypothetical protein